VFLAAEVSELHWDGLISFCRGFAAFRAFLDLRPVHREYLLKRTLETLAPAARVNFC
jgi:hypothetical protein